MEIEALYNEFLESDGATTDTRTASENQLFFALKGEQFDGNIFVQDALDRGCRMVVSDDPAYKDTPRVFLTESSLDTLQQLAHYHRKRSDAHFIGITGSNGKTTTKELIAKVLSTTFPTLVTHGNLNNHIGVPLTLLQLKGEQVAVIEMGANHVGEIAQLCRIADPDTGLITNIGKAHLEGFGSIEGVKKGKGELYDHLASKQGKAYVNISDPVLVEMASDRSLSTIPYAVGATGSLYAVPAQKGPFAAGTLVLGDASYDIRSSLVGSYNLQNIMAAISIGVSMDIPVGKILAAVASYVPGNNRSQQLKGKSNTLVLDAYNANPASMAGSVEHFATESGKPSMVILGDMLELGDEAESEHVHLLSRLVELSFDLTLLVGTHFFALRDAGYPFLFFRDMDDCIQHLAEEPPSGYHILLKGSRKIGVERATKILLDC